MSCFELVVLSLEKLHPYYDAKLQLDQTSMKLATSRLPKLVNWVKICSTEFVIHKFQLLSDWKPHRAWSGVWTSSASDRGKHTTNAPGQKHIGDSALTSLNVAIALRLTSQERNFCASRKHIHTVFASSFKKMATSSHLDQSFRTTKLQRA